MGFNNVIKRGIYFEPAFEKHLFSPGNNSFKDKKKYKLFFYARPRNPRNLFYTGIEFLNAAVSSGLINMNEWEIYFAGSDVPPIKFSNGLKPNILGNMGWKEYSNFLKTVDLGFCLMYTPHPSYPPLDIASSGGVVLTNRFSNKQTMKYSKNIICSDLDTNAMLKGFEQAIALAKNSQQRKQNYLKNNIESKWKVALEKTLSLIDIKK
jgi:hypothetical protein